MYPNHSVSVHVIMTTIQDHIKIFLMLKIQYYCRQTCIIMYIYHLAFACSHYYSFLLQKVELPIDDDSIWSQLARWGHTFTAITHSEGLIEVIMFGGSPGYYEVTWDVYKGKDFRRLSFPISFILGKPKHFYVQFLHY